MQGKICSYNGFDSGGTMSKIKQTNQAWKVALSMLGVIVGGAGMFYGIHAMKQGGLFGVYIDLASLATMLLTSLFAVFSIRCPKCKKMGLVRGIKEGGR
jgi:hypothetical protein